MDNKVAGGPAFSEEFKKLIQEIENRDTTKQMSDDELSNLRRIIDNEVIRRRVVGYIQTLANQLK